MYIPKQDVWPTITTINCQICYRAKFTGSITIHDHLDLTQDVFVTTQVKILGAKRKTMKPFIDEDHLAAWTKRVYTNKVIDFLRSKGRLLNNFDEALFEIIVENHLQEQLTSVINIELMDHFEEGSEVMTRLLAFIEWVAQSDRVAARMLRIMFEIELPPPQHANKARLTHSELADIMGVTENYVKDIFRGINALQAEPSTLQMAMEKKLKFRTFKHQRS